MQNGYAKAKDLLDMMTKTAEEKHAAMGQLSRRAEERMRTAASWLILTTGVPHIKIRKSTGKSVEKS